MLPTLDSTLEHLNAPEDAARGAGISPECGAGGSEGASAGPGGGGRGGGSAGDSANGERAPYVWLRATLHRAMQDIGYSFSRGPNQYDVAREKPSVRKQWNKFIDTVRKYREADRTIYYTDETWLNKNMSTYRSWNDGSTDASLKVPSGKGARIIAAHVASHKVGLVDGASWVFLVS